MGSSNDKIQIRSQHLDGAEIVGLLQFAAMTMNF